ncbi:MAG: tetratricopeptide repeat protein [Planctomycetota bacterium]|nr:tetratricopeptide repeat protein [Planctomycetota bacterium]MDP6763091.1 tetratricopeptide repeat protein [Planctomycetota bacterium]MDP6989012.1 tetratricopeptide repeat protein [Planctomycetota bacterium]
MRVPKREALTVGAVVLLAVALRVTYTLASEANPTHQQPAMDSLFHLEWARALAAGEEFEELAGRPFFRAPLYVWLVAGLLKLGGGSLLFVRLFQAMLGGATALLVHLVGKRAFDVRTGMLAALCAATYWVLVYFDAELLIPTLIIPLDLLAILLCLRLADAPRPGRAAAAGGVWGLSAIARPNVLLFMPLLALWILLRPRSTDAAADEPRRRLAWIPALAFSAGLMAPILPLTAHNALARDDFVLISSQAGVNLYIGNNPTSDGVTAIVPGTPGGWWPGYHASIALAEQAEGRELSASEVSAHYTQKALDFVRSEPGAALALFARKLRLFWSSWEIGNNHELRFFAHRFGSFVPFVSIGFPLLAGAGVAGFLLASRRRGEHFPLWGFLPVYMVGVVAFFVCARFRAPVLPVLMIYGAHAIWWGADRLRAGRAATLLLPCAVAAAVGGFSLVHPDYVKADEANGWMQLGTAELRRDDEAAARECFERSLAINPNNLYALVQLARLEREAGRTDEAVAHLERAVGLHPRKTDGIELLLDTLLAAGRHDELLGVAEAYARDYPGPAIPHYYRGRALAQLGRLEPALAAFGQARRLDPLSFRAPLACGKVAGMLGRWDEAGEHYARAASLHASTTPEWADQAFAGLVTAHARRGDPTAACEAARRWARTLPASPSATAAVTAHCR